MRLNRATFDYIRDNSLYSIEGQQWFFYNRQPIAFPPGSIEVQTVWRAIGEEDKARYQWEEFRDAKTKKPLHLRPDGAAHRLEGPAALALGDLRAVDNPYRPGVYDEGWLNPSRDSVACPAGAARLQSRPRRLRPGGHALGELPPARHPDRLCRRRRQSRDPRQFGAGDRLPAVGVLHVVPRALDHRAQSQRGGELRLRCRQQGARAGEARGHAPAGVQDRSRRTGHRATTVRRMPGEFLLPGQAEGGRARFLALDFVWSLIEAESVSAGGK